MTIILWTRTIWTRIKFSILPRFLITILMRTKCLKIHMRTEVQVLGCKVSKGWWTLHLISILMLTVIKEILLCHQLWALQARLMRARVSSNNTQKLIQSRLKVFMKLRMVTQQIIRTKRMKKMRIITKIKKQKTVSISTFKNKRMKMSQSSIKRLFKKRTKKKRLQSLEKTIGCTHI